MRQVPMLVLTGVLGLGLHPATIGPFGPTRQIWRCPESDQWDGAWCYNAKAHPHLSGPGELIIGYNVNTQRVRDLVGIAEIYRPRFIRVRMKP